MLAPLSLARCTSISLQAPVYHWFLNRPEQEVVIVVGREGVGGVVAAGNIRQNLVGSR